MAKADVAAPLSDAPARPMTAEELLRLPTGMGERYELVSGELKIMSPPGYEHGDIVAEIGMRLFELMRTTTRLDDGTPIIGGFRSTWATYPDRPFSWPVGKPGAHRHASSTP